MLLSQKEIKHKKNGYIFSLLAIVIKIAFSKQIINQVVACEYAKSDNTGMWISDQTMSEFLRQKPYQNIQFSVLVKKI